MITGISRVENEMREEADDAVTLPEAAGMPAEPDQVAGPASLKNEDSKNRPGHIASAGLSVLNSGSRAGTQASLRNRKQMVLFILIMALLVLATMIMPIAQMPAGSTLYISLMGTLFVVTAAWLLGT